MTGVDLKIEVLFNSSSKGHVKDFAFFGNAGFKIDKNTIFSLYGRADNHNTAGDHQTYKLSLNHKLDKITFKSFSLNRVKKSNFI